MAMNRLVLLSLLTFATARPGPVTAATAFST